MADGSGAGTQPVLGSGWPNIEFEARESEAGGPEGEVEPTVTSTPWLCRIHMDVRANPGRGGDKKADHAQLKEWATKPTTPRVDSRVG
jgi:hypothetical protein